MTTKVFVNGSFDILHYGHIQLLNTAKNYGTHLLVALDSDRRIAEKKGRDRPVNKEINRLTIMQNLKAVDEVKIFDSDTELIDIIRNYQPDVMIVGSDWRGKTVIGSEYAKELVFFERENNESTSGTLENFISRRQLR